MVRVEKKFRVNAHSLQLCCIEVVAIADGDGHTTIASNVQKEWNVLGLVMWSLYKATTRKLLQIYLFSGAMVTVDDAQEECQVRHARKVGRASLVQN
eukprot:4724077-Amphidinium_carterae.1